MHRIFFDWFLNVDMPLRTKVGKNCILYHAHGLVLNADVVIGEHCILRHTTTIGNKQNMDGTYSKSPIIGDYCDIGAHVVVIGPIVIGKNVTIGAGTIVTKDVPANCIVYGSPLVIKPKP